MKTTRLKSGAPATSANPNPPARPRFHAFLRAELARRCASNPQYSLRAFALDLGTDHSTLSQLIRGTRRFTEQTLTRLAGRLGLPDADATAFVELEKLDEESTVMHEELTRLTQDAARVVTEWQHHAILELTHLDSFRPDCRWIASVLDLGVDEVNVALQRLLRLGLLHMESPAHWSDRAADALFSLGAFDCAAIRALFETAADRAPGGRAALSSRPAEQSSTTMALDAAVVPKLIDCIVRFRRQVQKLAASSARAGEVYRLDLRFFPLTNLNSKEQCNGTTRHSLADDHQESR